VSSESAQTQDDILCQLGVMAILTARDASLPLSITDVIEVRSEEQVRRINAWRVVAMVQDVEAGGDRASN
jgi:hypothetical protein